MHIDREPCRCGLQWRRQLWGTGARAPSTSNNFILVHFRVNLTANYPSIVYPALKFAVSVPWPNFQLCPSSQQNPVDATGDFISLQCRNNSTRHRQEGAQLPSAAATNSFFTNYFSSIRPKQEPKSECRSCIRLTSVVRFTV